MILSSILENRQQSKIYQKNVYFLKACNIEHCRLILHRTWVWSLCRTEFSNRSAYSRKPSHCANTAAFQCLPNLTESESPKPASWLGGKEQHERFLVPLLSSSPSAFCSSSPEDMFIAFFERVRWRGGEREQGERNISKPLPLYSLMGVQTHNLGMCLNQKSNILVYGVELQQSEPPSWGSSTCMVNTRHR